MNFIKDGVSKLFASASAAVDYMSASSNFRDGDYKRSRDHVPLVASQAEPLPRPTPIPKQSIAGPRSEGVQPRRMQQQKQGDVAGYTKAFGFEKVKSDPFAVAVMKKANADRRHHEQLQLDKMRFNQALGSGVEHNLTPSSSTSNGLLATSRTTQLAEHANDRNGGLNWLPQNCLKPPAVSSNRQLPAKRNFSEAQASNKPKLSSAPTARDTLVNASPQLHPANIHVQTTASENHRSYTISSDSFYPQNSQSRTASLGGFGAHNHAIPALPVQPVSSVPLRQASDPITPDAPPPTRSTRSQSKRNSESAQSDQSVVVIDSDDDGVGQQSPKYTSPKTYSEKKSVSERMIPRYVIDALHNFGTKEWLFAYPVKDFRGILSDETQSGSDAGDHMPILPFANHKNIAYLFFTNDGKVIIVPDDGTRDCTSPPRSSQSFALADCASVVTTLTSEERTDSKNEFVLFFAFKPNFIFRPVFENDDQSHVIKHRLDDEVVLVDDALSSGNSATLGDTLVLPDTENSVLSVDDANSFSGLGFKLINPVFVDNQVHLKEADCRASVKRFSDFIGDSIRPMGFKDKGVRIINATNAFTHVTVGLPRQKPVNIVEDTTELLDYQVPDPEKSNSSALDPSSAPLLPKKVHRVISVGDFARLDKGECLSDATIDFYSSWLRESRPDKCRGIYFASSFFFKKLWSQTKDSKDRTDFSYMHKWNSIDIFSFDMVMFPVNLNYHWSLIVLENPAACLQPKGAGRCRLLYMDSLRSWDVQISELFSQWITWMHHRKTSPQGEMTRLQNFCHLSLEGVRQDNTYDCGVFVLRYMEQLALHWRCGFKKDEWTAAEISSDVQYKRKELQRLIRKLAIANLNSTNFPGAMLSAMADADGK